MQFPLTWISNYADFSTVLLTRFLLNKVFSRNLNALKSGNRCKLKDRNINQNLFILMTFDGLAKIENIWVMKYFSLRILSSFSTILLLFQVSVIIIQLKFWKTSKLHFKHKVQFCKTWQVIWVQLGYAPSYKRKRCDAVFKPLLLCSLTLTCFP